MDNKYESGVIFTSNQETAYKLRTKCSKIGFNLSYAVNLESLFEHILDNIRSLILVDVECDELSCLYDLLNKYKMSGNHKFILLDDQNKVIITPNNDTLYKTTNENACSLIKQIIHTQSNDNLFAINKSKLYGIAIEVVNHYGINSALQGSDYIVQAICLCIERGNTHINFHNDIYPAIADIYNTSKYNVEICIRRCVKDLISKNKQNQDVLLKKTTNISLIKDLTNLVKIKYINNSLE